MRGAALVACALALEVSLLAATASADPQDEVLLKRARAEALYDEALALLDRGEFAQACPKLEQSDQLDPALGTRFNLAGCYERAGKLASALARFRQVALVARQAGKANLDERSTKRAEALETKVARLHLVVTPPEPEAIVTIDDQPVETRTTAEGTSVLVPVDAHDHVVVVRAPNRQTFIARFSALDGSVGSEPKTEEMQAALVIVRPQIVRAGLGPPDGGWRTAGIITAGAGILALGAGAIFGLTALGQKGDAESACNDKDPAHCETELGVQHWRDAQRNGNFSTVGFIAGAALLGGGIALYLAAPRASLSARARTPSLAPLRLSAGGAPGYVQVGLGGSL